MAARSLLTARPLVALALIPPLFTTACAGWQVEPAPFAPHVERGAPAVRVTTADGSTLEITDPRLEQDSIVGVIVPQDGSTPWPASVAIRDVIRLERYRTDLARTALWGGVALLALLAAGSAIWAASGAPLGAEF